MTGLSFAINEKEQVSPYDQKSGICPRCRNKSNDGKASRGQLVISH